MNTTLRLFLLIALAIYFICISYFLKKKKLELKYTLLWIFCGLAMMIVVLLPDPFLALMRGMGIIDELNGLFSIVIFFLIIVLISMTAHITKLYHDFRKLVQRCALYEKRLREVEEKLK